jgi:acyl dehydratase
MLKLNGIDELVARVGTDLGTTEWYELTQDRITAFARDTDDFERIHLDPERGREAGFGGTIAHGCSRCPAGRSSCTRSSR